MLTDEFFEEFVKAGPAPPDPDGTKPAAKDYYTKAEVDEIVQNAISKTITEMTAGNVPQDAPEDPAEMEENDNEGTAE